MSVALKGGLHLPMSTAQVAALLFQLQQLDLELDRINAEQQSVTNSLQSNAALRKLRAEYTHAQQQVQTSLQTQKEAEWALEDLSSRLKAQEQRLYNGTVVNPKELQSLQQEAQRLRAQQSRQEDAVLEVIDAAEALQEMAHSKQLALKQAEQTWEHESAELVARRDQLEQKKQELQAKRARQSATLNEDLLSRYNTMRRTKQGRAVSRVEQNSCQWCRVILTPSELQKVRTSFELQMCTNCGRILYYDR